MAKLVSMPSEAIISGFKGKVDYYEWNGLACARKWPRSPGHNRAQAVEDQWEAFTRANQLWATLSPYVKEAYRQMATSTNLTAKDLFVKGYLSNEFIRL